MAIRNEIWEVKEFSETYSVLLKQFALADLSMLPVGSVESSGCSLLSRDAVLHEDFAVEVVLGGRSSEREGEEAQRGDGQFAEDRHCGLFLGW